ncbi:hypothetical protein AURDEDRAFT_172676 [Auricularia subglabra TFB-10046 SS5]|nr:hypothetical protein AURDEDRAFT_172676 [Auricularia subglabra TFB-10046 SS5]
MPAPYPNYYPTPQAKPAPVRDFGAARCYWTRMPWMTMTILSRLKREIDRWVARWPDREVYAILIDGFQHNEAKESSKLEAEVYRLKLDILKLTGGPPPPPPILAAPMLPVPAPALGLRVFGLSLAKPSALSKLGGTTHSQTLGPLPLHLPVRTDTDARHNDAQAHADNALHDTHPVPLRRK